MRLRQLGTTQSVTFVSPPEVHQSILDVGQKSIHDSTDSSDVLFWLMNQTGNSNRELQLLYLSQGFDFCHRMQASIDYKKFLTDPDHRNTYIDQLKRPEQQTLEQLYQPQPHEQCDTMSLSINAATSFTGDLTSFVGQLRQSYVESQVKGSIKDSTLEEVEQEREVAFEIEQERELQRPLTMKAYRYPGLHNSIKRFVTIGRLSGDEGYMEAATVLESTDLGRKHGIYASTLLRSLYVSTEFTRVVETKEQSKSIDNFLVISSYLLTHELFSLTKYIYWIASRELGALESADKRRASDNSRGSRGAYPYNTYNAKLDSAFDSVRGTVHKANAPL